MPPVFGTIKENMSPQSTSVRKLFWRSTIGSNNLTDTHHRTTQQIRRDALPGAPLNPIIRLVCLPVSLHTALDVYMSPLSSYPYRYASRRHGSWCGHTQWYYPPDCVSKARGPSQSEIRLLWTQYPSLSVLPDQTNGPSSRRGSPERRAIDSS